MESGYKFSKLPFVLSALEVLFPPAFIYYFIKYAFPCIPTVGLCPHVENPGPNWAALFPLIIYAVVIVFGIIDSLKAIRRYGKQTPFRYWLPLVVPVLLFIVGYVIFYK